MDKVMNKIKDAVRIDVIWIREFISEFMGTFILMIIGLSAMAHMIFKKEHDLFAVVFCWGMAVMFGMLTGAKNSGGHVNPMVTLCFASIGKLPWIKVPHYLAGQFLGAFAACLAIYANYWELLNKFDGGNRTILGDTGTGLLWTTFPDPNVSMTTCVIDTVLCTSVIMFGILAILDEKNANVPGHLHGLFVAFLVMTVVWTMGANCMCAINPARDFAPRVFAQLIGYNDAFSHRGFWWIPLVVPPLGGTLGCYAYQLTIGSHIPRMGAPLAEIKELDDLKVALNDNDKKVESSPQEFLS